MRSLLAATRRKGNCVRTWYNVKIYKALSGKRGRRKREVGIMRWQTWGYGAWEAEAGSRDNKVANQGVWKEDKKVTDELEDGKTLTLTY